MQSTLGVEFEKIGASRFDLTDPYHIALTLSWPAFAAAAGGAYLLVTGLFAGLYMADPAGVMNARPGVFLDRFFFSIETLATVGYGVMAPGDLYGHLVSTAEIITGVAITALLTGVIFVRFSKARAKIVYADVLVVSQHNGRPTLMLRIGNARLTVLTQVKVELHVLIRETSAEGAAFRRIHDLQLKRSRVPMFPLVLTLMHEITPDSPLHGLSAAAMTGGDLTFMLTIEARDPDLFATVHDLKTYGSADLRVGVRFADVVTQAADGHTIADLTRLSVIEPDPGTASPL